MSGTVSPLGMTVIERGWLSANQVLLAAQGGVSAAIVDTGFGGHSAQTLALVDHALRGARLSRIVNTHLHSDHCGGNRALQDRGSIETWIPAACLPWVRRWDEDALTYRFTGQPCPRFAADRPLVPGQTIALGPGEWEIHAAPGHDMDAVLLFEPQTRTLIAGDALWEERLAVIFPELVGDDGFRPARDTLALIERLRPREVIPGHGRPFHDVGRALAASRQRLDAFEADPSKHARHAARALLMFHLLDVRTARKAKLVAWMRKTPIYRVVADRTGLNDARFADWGAGHLQRLIDEGLLSEHSGNISVRPSDR
ncbi:MAG: MBL fold metallo-hydrolase [Burkholderiaceae bacterium]